MTISKLAMAAKKRIEAEWLNGEAYDLATQAAEALESAQLLQSPETAAELEKLRSALREATEQIAELESDLGGATARVAELEADNAALQRDKEHVAAAAELRLSKADVAKWLRKKAREYPTAPELQESAADAIARLADKVARGAISVTAEESADKLTRLLAPTQALRETDGEHYAAVHHTYRVPRDLPEMGATS